MNHVGLLEGAAREGGREDPRVAAGAHPSSPISMMRSVMASCTEPPYTPECRSLSLHSTCRHTATLWAALGPRPHPAVGELAEDAHRARSEIQVCCPRGLARHSLNHKAAATRAPPGGGGPRTSMKK